MCTNLAHTGSDAPSHRAACGSDRTDVALVPLMRTDATFVAEGVGAYGCNIRAASGRRRGGGQLVMSLRVKCHAAAAVKTAA